MSNTNIQNLVESLLTETKSSELDSATQRQLQDFQSAVEPLLRETGSIGPDDSILNMALNLEVAFAQEHPVAEGIIREIIDSLSKMGI